ncbi:MAG TPA: hypothetical protein PLE12_08505, partial [Propionicimonas sp.]|nr:hypothetical protein [Propionicimonas sp.]
AIQNRDWVSGALAGASGVLDAVSFAVNPIGGLVAMGVGWVLDHIEPLKTWLNDLTGDAGAVTGGSRTWANVSLGLQQAGADLLRSLDSSLGDATSRAVDAYKRLASDIGSHLAMAGDLANAISAGLGVAASIVQVVHDLVRDAIADVVGTAVSCLIPLPTTIADLVAKVAKWVARLTDKLKALVRSFSKLDGLFRQADGLLARLKTVFEKIARPVRVLSDLPTTVGTRIGNAAKELPDVASKWLRPRYGDSALAGLPTARQDLADLLSMPDTIIEFNRRGLEPWSLDDFLAKQQFRVDGGDLSGAEKEMLAHLRSNVGGIADGTIMSKFHLAQGGDLGAYSDVQKFTARSQDLQGLDSGQAFGALRGDYATGHDASGAATTWNHYDSGKPLYETRVQADAGFVDRTSTAYSTDMVDETGRAASGGPGLTAHAQNTGDPTGPYTGHGFTSGTQGTVVPEHYTTPAGENAGVRYQETYDRDTGRRTSIVVHNPLSGSPGAAIRIPTLW